MEGLNLLEKWMEKLWKLVKTCRKKYTKPGKYVIYDTIKICSNDYKDRVRSSESKFKEYNDVVRSGKIIPAGISSRWNARYEYPQMGPS